MVCGEHHQGVVELSELFELGEHATELGVGVLGGVLHVRLVVGGTGNRLSVVLSAPHVAGLVDAAHGDEHAGPVLVRHHVHGSVGDPGVSAEVGVVRPGHEAVAVERVDPGRERFAGAVGVAGVHPVPAAERLIDVRRHVNAVRGHGNDHRGCRSKPARQAGCRADACCWFGCRTAPRCRHLRCPMLISLLPTRPRRTSGRRR